MLGAWVTRSIFQQRLEKGLCKLQSSYSSFSSFSCTGHLQLSASSSGLQTILYIFKQLSRKGGLQAPMSYSSALSNFQFLVQNRLLYYRALRTLCKEREVIVSYDISQTFDTYRVYKQSAVIVGSAQKQPSQREQYLLRKLYVRTRSANPFQFRMYSGAYYCDHRAAHGQGY